MKCKTKTNPELTWSISKMDVFNSCKRKYFYDYYASHLGWSDDASELSKEVYKLKKLSNKDMCAGNLIHEKARDLIDAIVLNPTSILTPTCLEKHVNVAIYQFRNSCVQSNSFGANWTPKVKGFSMLQEYFYNDKINKIEGEEIKSLISKCICNVALSTTYDDIQSNCLGVIINGNGDFTSFEFEGVKVFAVLDLLYQNTNSKYVVVDWKTGKEDKKKHRYQMLVYARYVSEVYGIDMKDIVCRLEYISCGTFTEYTFTNDDLNELYDVIESGISIFKESLDDDELNIPKDISYFKQTNDTSICSGCKYKGICS